MKTLLSEYYKKPLRYKILEPLIELRKDGVRKVGEGLGLPVFMFGRIPFPGPALATRLIGEVMPPGSPKRSRKW